MIKRYIYYEANIFIFSIVLHKLQGIM